MPYSLVHLAVAREVYAPGQVSPSFLLGSLAPDAVRAPQETYRALKGRTHMLELDEGWPAALRQWLRGLSVTEGAPRDLIRGYAAHLLTDRLWRDTVVAELRGAVPVDMPWADFVRTYYAEMDLIEGALYDAFPWRAEAEKALLEASPSPVGEYISAADLDWWRRRTAGQWPSFARRARQQAPVYASVARVMAFVPEAAALVAGARRAWPEW